VHAGSATETIATVRRCLDLGVEVGAHPGYDDRENYGRLETGIGLADFEALVAAQVAAIAALSPIGYVKAHGALYHRCQQDPAAAERDEQRFEELRRDAAAGRDLPNRDGRRAAPSQLRQGTHCLGGFSRDDEQRVCDSTLCR